MDAEVGLLFTTGNLVVWLRCNTLVTVRLALDMLCNPLVRLSLSKYASVA
jgi:hypothetical protein